MKFQDDVKLSYPSPYSSTPASFTPVPPLLLNTRKAEVDLDALTEEQQASADAGVRFMRSLIQPKLDAQGKEIPRKSPIPLISASSSSNGPSSATVTPRKSTTPYLHLNSASASAGKPSIHLVSHSDTHVFPSPASQGLSSPDPLAIPRCQSSKPSSSSSSTGWVVEVPAHPKKRLSNANLIEKAAKRHAPHLPSDPFDTYTSSEMDVDPPLDVDDNAHSTSPPSAPSPHIDLPTRKKGKVGQVQSPSKAASLKSTAQLQEQQLQDFVTLVEDILDEEETPTSKYYIQPSLESFSGSETSRLLEPSTMRKISKGVRALVKTNSGKKSFGQKVEVDQMNRLLRILQRSITIAENLAIVPVSANGSKKARNQKSPSKTPKKNKKASSKSNSESPMPSSARRRSTRSATPASYHEDDDEEDRDRDSEEDYRDVDEPTTPSSQSRPKLNKRTSSSATKARKGKKVVEMEEEEAFEWDPDNLQLLENNLIALKNAIIATETVMIILGSASLPKQLYSEDVINSGLNLLKAQLTAVIYPSLDCERSTLGSATQEDGIATSIRKILTAASASFTGIAMLLKQEEATDTAVINAVYIAIAPFFCEYGVKGKAKDVLGALEMKVVRGQALVILRTVSY